MFEEENEVKEKQNYLRQNILDAGFDTDLFAKFLKDKKGDAGVDINNWSLPELNRVVQEFISLYKYKNINQQEEQNANLDKNKANIGIEIKYPHQQLIKKTEELNYGVVSKNEINCLKSLNIEYSKYNNIQVIIDGFEKVEGGIFRKPYMIYLVRTIPFNWNVKRRFSDFQWLRQTLVSNYNYCLIPSIKEIEKNFFLEERDEEIYAKRERIFEKFLNYIIIDPILKNTQLTYDFLRLEKDDEFLKMKKVNDKIKQLEFKIDKVITPDGKANIEINEEKEKYLNDIKESSNLKENILKNINKTIESLNYDLINASEKSIDIYQNFNSIKENSIKYKENETLIKIYSEMSSIFLKLSLLLTKQKEVIFINLNEYFEFIRSNYSSVKDLVNKAENLKNTFYESFKNLKIKKENLFKRKEVTEWDLDPKDTSVDKNLILTNKNLALNKMLYKETEQVNNQKINYGFNLNRIIIEYERMKLNNIIFYHKYCLDSFEIMKKNITNFNMSFENSTKAVKHKQENENNREGNMNVQNDEENNKDKIEKKEINNNFKNEKININIDRNMNTNFEDLISQLDKERIENKKLIEKISKLEKELNEAKNKNLLQENKIKELKKELDINIKKFQSLQKDLDGKKLINKNIENESKEYFIDTIIEKDKEIKELKTKISRYPCILEEGEKLISIIFQSSDQSLHSSIICKNTDKFHKIEELICEKNSKFIDTENFFYLNGAKINKNKTIEQNGIKDDDIILLNTFEE